MISRVRSSALMGMNAYEVTVEADVSRGLPKFEIVGLAQASIQEGRNRIQSALRNSGISWTNKRIVVNLAPTAVSKQGANFDLPIALALLVAMGTLPEDALDRSLVLGELGLDGSVRSVRGAPIFQAFASQRARTDQLILPHGNLRECSRLSLEKVLPTRTLGEVIEILRGEKSPDFGLLEPKEESRASAVDFSEVRGQRLGRRAAEIAAAGGHHLLLAGAPGVGKSLIARRIPSILPALSEEEEADLLQVRSLVADSRASNQACLRPFREPHHSASLSGMTGGGRPFHPGELSLAHRGVLFMDELPEFRRDVIEVLREPLEVGSYCLSRLGGGFEIPSRFQLVAAMNLCPCGALGDPQKECRCPPPMIDRYRRKVSGPILDRIDVIALLHRPKYEQLWSDRKGEGSHEVRARVLRARAIQKKRYDDAAVFNANASHSRLKEKAKLDSSAAEILEAASLQWGLSARSLYKTVAVARTIADLVSKTAIDSADISEALQYRWEALPTL